MAESDIARVNLNVKLDKQEFLPKLKNKASPEYQQLRRKVVDAVSLLFLVRLTKTIDS